MKLPFVFGKNDLRLCDVEEPRAGPPDVVLRVSHVGICGSDLGYIAAGGVTGPATSPIPLGHELSGVVDEKGSAVTAFDVGDRVILNPLVNLVGNGGSEGGFARRLLVRDVVGRPGSLLKLPASVPLDIGALVEPLAVATHALNRLGARAEDAIAVFGAGPIGLAATAVLAMRGCRDVVVFDLSAFRRERAMLLGARAAIDPREEAPDVALRRLHGTVRVFRTDCPATTRILEASGAPVLPAIVAFARAQATICVVSGQKAPVPVDFATVMARELTLTGSLGYPTELQEVIDMLERQDVDLTPLVSHRLAGEDVMDAFGIARDPGASAKVLVDYGDRSRSA